MVLRCELDGSSLDVFARGLRNPQELAFDDFGNLFTGDNNSDGGDRARWVHVVEGGDSGWRIGYQHLHAPPRRGPWNAEKLWYPQWEGQAAYIVPPLANLGYGPSGLAYYPGTGLPEKYRGHFFLCDFRGGASSGIHAFSLKPKGASFEMASYEQFLWEALPTDVEFGPDGAMYYTDWIQSWNKTDAGRIYRISHPESRSSKAVLETRRLLRDGLRGHDDRDLTLLFQHPDRRVRLEAQFELVRRGTNSVPALHQYIADLPTLTMSRPETPVHTLWALGQLARKNKDRAEEILNPAREFLKGSPEIRAVAAQVFADSGLRSVAPRLIEMLNDASGAGVHLPMAEAAAALTLAKLRVPEAISPVMTMIERNADRDPFLRHAGVMALAACATPEQLAALPTPSTAAQLAVVVALRRQESPYVAKFLSSTNPLVVLEAARAINDVPIEGAMPSLARLIREVGRFDVPATNKVEVLAQDAITASISSVAPETGSTTPYEQLFQRVLNANLRVGEAQQAAALAQLAANDAVPASLRAEALQILGDWANPPGRDRILGLWRPLRPRPREVAERELASRIKEIFPKAPEAVQVAALDAIQKLRVTRMEATLLSLVRGSSPASVRIKALNTLMELKSRRLDQALAFADQSGDPSLVSEARLVRARLNPAAAVAELGQRLESASTREKQQILDTVARVASPAFAPLLRTQMQKLLIGQLSRELELDVLDAASKLGTPELLAMVQKFEAARPNDNLGPFREVLQGGDADAGRVVFFERAEVSCARCHMIGTEGGMAGPKLTGIGSRQGREYLLESIVFPNKELAKGFENVLVSLNDGSSVAGSVEKEDANELVINSPEDGEVRVKKANIKSRQKALSGMPEEFRQILTKQDLRNLVEFLASLK